eukprot:756709-Hanusia_phi.AAC.10
MAPLRCRVSSTPSALQGRPGFRLGAPLPHSDPPRPLSSRFPAAAAAMLSPESRRSYYHGD